LVFSERGQISLANLQACQKAAGDRGFAASPTGARVCAGVAPPRPPAPRPDPEASITPPALTFPSARPPTRVPVTPPTPGERRAASQRHAAALHPPGRDDAPPQPDRSIAPPPQSASRIKSASANGRRRCARRPAC